jgi:hypothetical protein
MTQKVIEQDFGLTDFNDNQREGDIAFKAPTKTAAEREIVARLEHDAKEYAKASQLSGKAKEFWAGSPTGAPSNIVANVLADVRSQAKAEKNLGMEKVMQMGKAGKGPGITILARD